MTVEVTPNGSAGNEARRYTYSAAGYLVEVESHDGTGYLPQAEMVYNGLGQRLSMTAYAGGLSLTTQYALDSEGGAAPLAATANNESTYYLYGLDAVAERAAGWSYYLHDGLGSLRKVVDADAGVTLERNYTPWGDVLSQSGTIDPAQGYMGGWVDAAIGLIYVGNGQYYDPHTGRFLTRDAQPGKFNPYVPSADPTGLLVGPMALLVLARGRRGKKGSGKVDLLLLVMVVLVVGSMTVAACGGGETPPPPTEPPVTPPTITPGSVVTPTEQPTDSPAPASPPAETPTLPSQCVAPTYLEEDTWTNIARVIYYEGASSFAEKPQADRVFERQLWALRSIKLRQQSWRSYTELVTDCGLMSACAEYKSNHFVGQEYVDNTKAILSEERCEDEPGEFRNRIIHWISPQNFPRYNPDNNTKVEFYTTDQSLNCQFRDNNGDNLPDASGCQLPDLRNLEWVRNRSIQSLIEERFIDLGYVGPVPTNGNPNRMRWQQNEYYHECYWIGVYFAEDGKNFDELHAGKKHNAPTFPTNSEEAKKFLCPVPIQNKQ